MSSSMFLGIFSWIGDFFKALFDLIPKIMYLLYASLACVIDVLQLFFRKLAGLDVYYVDGEAVTGDLVTNFITGILGINQKNLTYSALSTVFYAMIIFGVIICFGSTIIAIIKSHYSYDEKAAKGPMQYVYSAGKAIINMVAVPIIVVLGLYVSDALLEALDSITSTTSSSIVQLYGADAVSEFLVSVDTVKGATGNGTTEYSYRLAPSFSPGVTYYEKTTSGSYVVATGVTQENWPEGENTKYYVRTAVNVANSTSKTYIFYDVFGFSGFIQYGSNDALDGVNFVLGTEMKKLAAVGAKGAPFSGTLFKVAAHNANRARLHQMGERNFNLGGIGDLYMQFSGSSEDAYGNHLFKNATDSDSLAEMIDTAFACNLHMNRIYKLNYAFDGGIVSFKYFTNFLTQGYWGYSKFNIGLVWYYYDLWQFNFIVGFAGCIVCVSIFFNIILGMIARLFMCIVLFLIAPPLFGLAPLDGGGAAKKWRENFMKQVLMTYGAVVGMNLMLMILPYMNDIDFFNIPIADGLAQTLVIIVGLITIKAVIETLSNIIGAADAQATGGKIADDVKKTTGTAAKMTAGAALLGAAAFKAAGPGGLKALNKIPGVGKAFGPATKAWAGIEDKVGTKLRGFGGKLKERITGMGGVNRAQRNLDRAKADLEAFNTGAKQSWIFGQMDGQNTADFDLAAAREQWKKAGLSDDAIRNMETAIQTRIAAGDTTFSKTSLSNELGVIDPTFAAKRIHYNSGTAHFNEALRIHEDSVQNMQAQLNQATDQREGLGRVQMARLWQGQQYNTQTHQLEDNKIAGKKVGGKDTVTDLFKGVFKPFADIGDAYTGKEKEAKKKEKQAQDAQIKTSQQMGQLTDAIKELTEEVKKNR
ncbi:MAG: hypothetical protein IJ817_02940 [Clostridia bacterium]|nr:hypothetical protein [Clostridia bacterium]